jgi:cytochrome c-type biogenesis protein
MTHALSLLASSSDTATGVGIPLALAAGLVSFLSPCVLPLVPGYLSTVIGVTPADLKEGVGVRRVLVPSLLFIASFSAIFILLGLSATVAGSTLNSHKHALEQVGGILIVLMGLAFLAVVKRHFPVIIGAGGAVMIVLGVLILTGEFTVLNSWLSKAFPWQTSV